MEGETKDFCKSSLWSDTLAEEKKDEKKKKKNSLKENVVR